MAASSHTRGPWPGRLRGMMPFDRGRLLAGVLASVLAVLAAGCNTPAGPARTGSHFGLVPDDDLTKAAPAPQASAIAGAAGQGLGMQPAPGGPSALPPALPVATASSAPGSSASGGGGDGPGQQPIQPGQLAGLFWLPDGSSVQAPAGDTVQLPGNVTGQVTFEAAGWVPSSIDLPASGVTAIHPTALAPSPAPATTATLTGTVTPAGAGITVSYFSAGRQEAVVTTTASDGSFRLAVPVAGAEDGILLAHRSTPTRGAGLGRVHVVADSAATAAPIALADPTGSAAAAPSPPAPMATFATALEVAGGTADAPYRVAVDEHAEQPPSAPDLYDLTGFSRVLEYAAVAPDRSQGAVTSGPPGKVPPFLPAPVLSGLPADLVPGAQLTWPAVPGASLYTLRLTSPYAGHLLWEGLTVAPHATLPGGLALPAHDLILRIDAWDTPYATPYAVAAVRDFRVPLAPVGPWGRRTWASRLYNPS